MLWAILLPTLALAAILLFWLLLKSRPKTLEKVLIKEHSYSQEFTKKELKRTLISLLVFSLVGFGLDWAIRQDYTQLYANINEQSKLYLVVSFFLALGINDIYFYLTHRILHWKIFYTKVHYIHHQSHYPNPWSSFSFHPIEAVMQIGVVPVVALLLPIHTSVLIGFASFMLLVSVYGHCGYELRANKPVVFNIFNNSIHHNQHHTYFKYNFGLYLNIWDRLFKTNHPSYTDVTEEFKRREKS